MISKERDISPGPGRVEAAQYGDVRRIVAGRVGIEGHDVAVGPRANRTSLLIATNKTALVHRQHFTRSARLSDLLCSKLGHALHFAGIQVIEWAFAGQAVAHAPFTHSG
jgi:hypothetical protein